MLVSFLDESSEPADLVMVMPSFSQRKGIKPLEKSFQKEAIDSELRNSLWSVLYELIYKNWDDPRWDSTSQKIENLFNEYWWFYFKRPSDNRPQFHEALSIIRDYFFKCPWNEVYDFVEFTAQHADWVGEGIRGTSNIFMQTENSAYRFVGNEIAEITSEVEIKAIEEAVATGIPGVQRHLMTALSLLSDRKKPDYRNSIKESISAVEAICRLLSDAPKATLGTALKHVSAKTPFHPAFEKGLLALYGFTSDEHGIRHSLLEEPKLQYSDAKFMLVLASGFCGFLLAKCAENGIEVKS